MHNAYLERLKQEQILLPIYDAYYSFIKALLESFCKQKYQFLNPEIELPASGRVRSFPVKLLLKSVQNKIPQALSHFSSDSFASRLCIVYGD